MRGALARGGVVISRWRPWAFGIVALGCCPEPEGCLESPGTLRYRVEGLEAEESRGSSCGIVDLAVGEVIAFKEVGDYYPSSAERQCSGCPMVEVIPTGEIEGWTEVSRNALDAEHGRIVSQFDAVVDGCAAEVVLRLGPIDRGDGQADFWMYREIAWNQGCAAHAGSCYDEFLMTELPDEE